MADFKDRAGWGDQMESAGTGGGSVMETAMQRIIAGLLGLIWTVSAGAQLSNPVYVDDSQAASDALRSLDGLIASSNLREAVRQLQEILDNESGRVVESEHDADLFQSVRDNVHARLLGDAELLGRYRLLENDRAAQQLQSGRVDDVEQARLLTTAGFEAALRVAQRHIESARFESARLTLLQLERHPDRKDAGAADAAQLMMIAAGYINRDSVWDLAARWAREGGLTAPEGVAREVPVGLFGVTHSLRPGPTLNVADIPSKPLWSGEIDPDQQIEVDDRQRQGLIDPSNRQYQPRPALLPAVRGDTVYINDGRSITAWDRYTLTEKWRVRPRILGAETDAAWQRSAVVQHGRGGIEDTTTVTVAGGIVSRGQDTTTPDGITGGVVLATTGVATGGGREGDPRVHALDAATGKLLWSVDPSGLDPQLAGSSVRGPILVEGDTVVVSLRKSIRQRRLLSVYFVGMDIKDGSLRWHRLIGSAGSLPFRQGTHVADAGTLHEGVVYRSDLLGVIAAVEVATGRPVWVRKVDSPELGMASAVAPWSSSAPVVHDDSVFVLSPDRRSILELDRRTGEIKAQRGADLFGQPHYLLGVGSRLAAVGEARIAFVDINEFSRGPVTLTMTFPRPRILGRVAVAGDDLLVPLRSSVAVVRSAEPDGSMMSLPLQSPGNVRSIGNQLVVIEESRIESYLAWDVARTLLEARMDAQPGDAMPAVTLADLAYRASQFDDIAPAADRALEAIELDPLSDEAAEARQRLFEALDEMVSHALAVAMDSGDEQRPDAGESSIDDPQVIDALIDRLGRTADNPSQRVSFLLARSSLRGRAGAIDLAIDACQRVLADPLLREADWEAPTSTVRAELEATRRVRRLVCEFGGRVYADFDAEARRALDSAMRDPTSDADDFAQLAVRYPGSVVSALAWLRASEAHEQAGEPHEAVDALSASLAVAEQLGFCDVNVDPQTLGEIGGRLVVGLESLDRLSAAAQVLGRFRQEHKEIVLADHGRILDAHAKLEALLSQLEDSRRAPRIGSTLDPRVQVLEGWTIMAPLSHGAQGESTDAVLMMAPALGKIGLFGPGARGTLDQIWSRTVGDDRPMLLRLEPEAAYIVWLGADGTYMECIDTILGKTRWQTPTFEQMVSADGGWRERVADEIGQPRIITTPQDGDVHMTDLLVTMDDEAIAMVDRSGRVVVIEQGSGRLRWSLTPREIVLGRVHDAVMGGGVLVIGGADDAPGFEPGSPGIAVYDVRTGQAMERMDSDDFGLSTEVRWVRLSDDGLLVAGLDHGVLGRRVGSGAGRAPGAREQRWLLVDPEVGGSREGWIFGERLFLLGPGDQLWLVSLGTGTLTPSPLETRGRLMGPTPIEATRIGGNVAFSTATGIVVFDIGGGLVGVDALGGDFSGPRGGREMMLQGRGMGSVLVPQVSEDFFVSIETDPRLMDEKEVYDLHLLDAPNARLLKSVALAGLHESPRRLIVLDGRIVITAGNMTVVYSAPYGTP